MPMASQSSGPKTRVRTIPSPGAAGTLVVDWESTHPLDNPKSRKTVTRGELRAAAYQGRQKTVSENHPQWRTVKRRSTDIGGDFFTQRVSVQANMSPRTIRVFRAIDLWRKQTTVYTGPVLAVDQNQLSSSGLSTFGIPPVSISSNAVLDAFGAEAVAAVKPTNSIADLSVFLGELMREGLPKLAGAALSKPSSPRSSRGKALDSSSKLGEEYLNLEFGWKPIINDVNEFAKAITHANLVYRQYLRDSGRVVRRRYVFPSVESETRTLMGSAQRAKLAVSNSDLLEPLATAQLWKIDKIITQRWFSGAFTYHLPNLDKSGKMAHYAAVVRKLSGASIDPEVIWNLAPWSWAVDWFTNVGDVLSNVSDMATDGLVMRWGYMMEHTVHTRTFTLSGPSGYKGNPAVSDVVVVVETKLRRKANPFGFGVTWGALSARQSAILAALGITKGKSKVARYA